MTQRVDLERTDGPGAGGNTPDGVGGPVSLEMVQQVGAKIAAAISTVVLGKPEVEIHATAKELGTDLIVVGSHGRHGFALLMGSTANGVMHGAHCDVLAVRVGMEK